MPLDILYLDDWIVAIDKPAGYLVHPAEKPQEGDLVAMKILRDQIGKRVYNIHRIDRPTTGVVVFGIDRGAARELHAAWQRHEVAKTYWAVVAGEPPAAQWECREPIRKSDTSPAQEAHTTFRVRERNDGLALIEATPHTGRFHQIRRHLLHAGIPIVGDFRYAGEEESFRLCAQWGLGTRMLLQARQVALRHPVTGEHLSISAPVDPLFARCFPRSL